MNRMQLSVVAATVMLSTVLPSTAHALVFMRNADSCGDSCWANTIEFAIEDEPIAGDARMTLYGQLEIVPPMALGHFALLWGCVRADGSNPSLEVTYRTEELGDNTPPPQAPNCETFRLLGTWGMYPDHEAVLMPQEIHGREVTFSGDFVCDADLGNWFTGGYVWIKKPFTRCAPLGLADTLYIRGEARRADGGSGLGQINFAKMCEEGSDDGGPAMQMRTQVKGATFRGEPVSQDNVPVLISQTEPEFCVRVGPGSEGVILSSGYRLKSVGHSQPRLSSHAPPWRSQGIYR